MAAPQTSTVSPLADDLRDLRSEIAGLSDLLKISMTSSRDSTVDVLRRELQEMSGMIQQAKREIAAMNGQCAQSPRFSHGVKRTLSFASTGNT